MTHLDRSWSPPPQFASESRRNISEIERWMSGLGGAALRRGRFNGARQTHGRLALAR